MITQTNRPQIYDQVVGQKENIKILKAIAKNPEQSPHSLIFAGEFGTGKTTLSRIFAKAINCQNKTHENPCLECPTCKNVDYYYQEYDSIAIGNIDNIKTLRDTFYNSQSEWRVIVFDEAHAISNQAQTALLKAIEECTDNIIFIFCTTEPDKILPTIRSRSLLMTFPLINEAAIAESITGIDPDIPSEVVERIVAMSNGHVRNAHMLLDRYYLIKEDFMELYSSTVNIFNESFFCAIRGDLKGFETQLTELLTHPMSQLKTDYEKFVLNIAKNNVVEIQNQHVLYQTLWKNKQLFPKVFQFLSSDLAFNSFNSDARFQSYMYLLFSQFKPKSISETTVNNLRH